MAGHDIPGYSLVFPPLGALRGGARGGRRGGAGLGDPVRTDRRARVRARRAVGRGVVCAGGARGRVERADHVRAGGELRAGGGAGVDAPPSAGGGDPRGGVRGVQPGGGRAAGAGGAHAHARRALAAQRCWCSECRPSWSSGRWRACLGRGAGSPTRCSRSSRPSRRSGVPGGAPGRAAAAVDRGRGVPRGVRGVRGGALPDGRQRGALRGAAGGAAAAVRAAAAPAGGLSAAVGGGWRVLRASACGRCGGRCAKRRRWRATSRRAPPTTCRSSASWRATGAAR